MVGLCNSLSKINFYANISNRVSYKLNFARGLAALLVLLGHLRASWFVPYADLLASSKGIVNQALFFVTRIGHECVIVFFVLSGFLVGGSAIAEVLKEKFSFKKYMINRLSRMWTVLIPVLMVGWVVDLQSLGLDSNLDFAYKLTPTIFFGNVFFLQTVVVPSFGSNVPLWSLACEFWYYLLFPALMLLLNSRLNSYVKLLLSSTIIFLLFLIMPHIIKYFPVWLMGVGIRFIPRHKLFQSNTFYLLILILLVFGVVVSNFSATLWSNYLLGLIFSGVIYFWMNQDEDVSIMYFKNVVTIFADFSFSLYVTHYFLIYYVIAYLQNQGFSFRLASAGLVNWLLYLITVFLLISFSYIFYLVFERQTYKLREFLNRLIVNR